MYTWKKILAAVTCLAAINTAAAQSDVEIPKKIADPVEEFSTLTTIGKQLLLVPQYPVENKTHLVKKCLVTERAAQHKPLEENDFTEVTIENLTPIVNYINRNGRYYQGFEGAVAVNNTVFFSIETDDATDSCYLIKGYFHKNTITLDAAHIKGIAKVKCNGETVGNAGYESLTYNPATKHLLAVFEYTNVSDPGQTPVAFLADTSLQEETPLQPVYIQQPVPFRITDLCTTDKGVMYGINFWWAGEYKTYFACNSSTPMPISDSAAFTNTKNKLNCYGRVLQLQLSGNQLSWQPVKEIGYDCINWEGITLCKDDYILISDANKGKYKEKVTTIRVIQK